VSESDFETAKKRRSRSTGGLLSHEKKISVNKNIEKTYLDAKL